MCYLPLVVLLPDSLVSNCRGSGSSGDSLIGLCDSDSGRIIVVVVLGKLVMLLLVVMISSNSVSTIFPLKITITLIFILFICFISQIVWMRSPSCVKPMV